MPPHLHPRSWMTSSLFATTLLASFLVVGLPHVLPCPRPATRRLEGEQQLHIDEHGRPRRRMRRKTTPTTTPAVTTQTTCGRDGQTDNDLVTKRNVGGEREMEREREREREEEKEEEEGVRMEKTKTITRMAQFQTGKEGLVGDGDDAKNVRRECPIPKPGGILGEVLGVRKRP